MLFGVTISLKLTYLARDHSLQVLTNHAVLYNVIRACQTLETFQRRGQIAMNLCPQLAASIEELGNNAKIWTIAHFFGLFLIQ